jgi:hypothetical protein
MVDDAPCDAILDQFEVDNHATITANTTCDLTHTREHKVLAAKRVQSQAHLARPVAPFLTRRNIDHCFASVIVSKASTADTTCRVLNALNWHATHREHVGANPKFECKSHRVMQALLLCKRWFKRPLAAREILAVTRIADSRTFFLSWTESESWNMHVVTALTGNPVL